MADPYVKKDPGDIIRAQDWNDLQSQARDEIRGHLHTGGDQGRLLGGASIDPSTTLKVSQLEITGDLLAKTRKVLDEIDTVMSRVTALEAKTASTGPLTIGGNLQVNGELNVTGLINIGNTVFLGDHDIRLRGPQYNDLYGLRFDPRWDGPLLWGHTGGSLATWDGKTLVSPLTWRNDGSLTISGAFNITPVAVVLNDHEIRFRGPTDTNHGVGWKQDVDGAVLWGYRGGQLRSTLNGVRTALIWREDGAVVARVSNPSDISLKTDIVPVETARETLAALRPVRFRWRDLADPREQLGLIAQEVEAILPELVTEGADKIKALNYIALVPLLIRAFQEQQAEIERLHATVTARQQ